MKKLIALVLSLCMLLSLAACGAEKTPETNPPAVEDPKPTVQDSGATNEEPREAELNIMMSFPQYMEQWETYVKQFEAKMLAEENIKVTVNLEMPSSDQYESVLQARLSGDDAPDLYTLHCNNLGTYNDAGYLYDLSGEPLADVIYENVKSTVSIDGSPGRRSYQGITLIAPLRRALPDAGSQSRHPEPRQQLYPFHLHRQGA